MQLASYHGTRDGVMGAANVIIRFRLRGPFSHSEIVFQPGDGVDHLMPDGTCEPDATGAVWCCSSTGLEDVPPWSIRRAGAMGGVRMKRIILDPHKWTLDHVNADPLFAAQWAHDNEGRLYDFQLIMGFVTWAFPNKESRVMCSEACATMLQIPDAWRFDPCLLRAVVKGVMQ